MHTQTQMNLSTQASLKITIWVVETAEKNEFLVFICNDFGVGKIEHFQFMYVKTCHLIYDPGLHVLVNSVFYTKIHS